MKSVLILLFSAVFMIVGLHSIHSQDIDQRKNGYKVVINHEEQYSILPINMQSPKGWKDTKMRGNQKKCQQYIEEVWTDMRPLSIRNMGLSDDTRYGVVINHEEQYSIWPLEMDLPKNWKAVGSKGSLAQCSAYIEEVWTDMRPLSIRKKKR